MPPKYVMKASGPKVRDKGWQKGPYKIEKDEPGMWIKPDSKEGKPGKITAAIIRKASARETAIDMLERYGHISYDTLRTPSEFPKEIKKKIRCPACEQGKARKPASPRKSTQVSSHPNNQDFVHADLVGPIDTATPSKQYQFLLEIVDYFSRYTLVQPLRKKSDTSKVLVEIINKLEAATSLQVSQIQADWSGEFRNNKLQEELKQRGITSKETVPKHSQTNAKMSERTEQPSR